MYRNFSHVTVQCSNKQNNKQMTKNIFMKIENPFLSEAELVAKRDNRLCKKALAISLPHFKREKYFFSQIILQKSPRF